MALDTKFTRPDGQTVDAVLFEYSDRSAAAKPGVLRLKTVILVEEPDAKGLDWGMKLNRLAPAEQYFVKEITKSGVGLMELTLEKVHGNETLTHGKF